MGVFRSKKLDDAGSRVEVLTDGAVRITPPPAVTHAQPVTMTRDEFIVVQSFAQWCWRDLPPPPKEPPRTPDSGA